MKTLFLEQRCGMRTRLDAKTASSIGKGLLLRRAAGLHAVASFPEHGEALKKVLAWDYYQDFKGCSENGKIDLSYYNSDGDDDDDMEGDAQTGEKDASLSSYKSRAPLIAFAKGLMGNKYERTFLSIVKEAEKDKIERVTLDLTSSAAGPLQRQMSAIASLHTEDFKTDSKAKVSNVESSVVHQVPGTTEGVVVVVSNQITDDADYRMRVEKYTLELTQFTEAAEKEYINNRVSLVVRDSSGDADKTAKKLAKLPAMMEKKRKAYIYDEHVARPFDWVSLKRNRKTVFHPRECDFDGDDLDSLLEVYYKTRTEDNGTCNDIISVLLPPPPPNSEVNRSLQAACAKVKAILPRHQRPRIGTVERSHTDVLSQTRERLSFVGNVDSSIIFTSQAPLNVPRKAMSFCEGDTHFNRWKVKSPSFQQLPRCSQAEADMMWTGSAKPVSFVNDVDIPHEESLASEMSTDNEQVVPFPQELSMQLTQEMIRIFGVEVAVLCTTGAGFSLMACIERNIRAIGICETNGHRKFVMQQLINYVRAQRFVNMSAAPVKAPELLQWESKMKANANQRSNAATDSSSNAATASTANVVMASSAPVKMAVAAAAVKAAPQTPTVPATGALASFGSVVL